MEKIKWKKKRGITNLKFPNISQKTRGHGKYKVFRKRHIEVYVRRGVRSGKNWKNRRRKNYVWFVIYYIYDEDRLQGNNLVQEYYHVYKVVTSYSRLKGACKRMLPYVIQDFKFDFPSPTILNIEVTQVTAGKITTSSETFERVGKRRARLEDVF